MRRNTKPDNPERIPGPSKCCQDVTVLECVFVWQSAVQLKSTHGGRTRIGQVKVCGKCLKPVSDIKMIRNDTANITRSAWDHILKVSPTAPFYFALVGGCLVPQGYENTKPPDVQGSIPYGDPGQD